MFPIDRCVLRQLFAEGIIFGKDEQYMYYYLISIIWEDQQHSDGTQNGTGGRFV